MNLNREYIEFVNDLGFKTSITASKWFRTNIDCALWSPHKQTMKSQRAIIALSPIIPIIRRERGEQPVSAQSPTQWSGVASSTFSPRRLDFRGLTFIREMISTWARGTSLLKFFDRSRNKKFLLVNCSKSFPRPAVLLRRRRLDRSRHDFGEENNKFS